jgi:hypothetical protein
MIWPGSYALVLAAILRDQFDLRCYRKKPSEEVQAEHVSGHRGEGTGRISDREGGGRINLPLTCFFGGYHRRL